MTPRQPITSENPATLATVADDLQIVLWVVLFVAFAVLIVAGRVKDTREALEAQRAQLLALRAEVALVEARTQGIAAGVELRGSRGTT